MQRGIRSLGERGGIFSVLQHIYHVTGCVPDWKHIICNYLLAQVMGNDIIESEKGGRFYDLR